MKKKRSGYNALMSLFCLLWTPLFYLFWRALNEEPGTRPSAVRFEGIWALVLGSITAFIQFFLGSFIDPGGFGLSRWISACVDIVALPAAVPFIVYVVLLPLRIVSRETDCTNMSFLWLIPVAAFKALNWSSQNDPVLLLGVPVLWTAIVAGMGFFFGIMRRAQGMELIPAAAGALVLPLAAATSYWAFFCQHTLLGIALLIISSVPAGVSLWISFFGRK